jgi:hypothetical protein
VGVSDGLKSVSDSTVLISTCASTIRNIHFGHALAQVVSYQLPSAVAWVQNQRKSSGICGGHSGTGACVLQVLQFPLPFVHSTNCSTVITIYRPGLVQ